MSNKNGADAPETDNPEASASAVFVELMRQAAAKSTPKPPAAPASAAEIDLEPPAENPQIHRVRRRLTWRRPPPGSLAGGFFGTTFVVTVVAALVATLLMFFVNPDFLDPAVVRGLQQDSGAAAGLPTARPTAAGTPQWERRIGIVIGHRGFSENGLLDSGAICQDVYGNVTLKEVDINFEVGRRVVAALKSLNYTVDMLDELDPRLDNYRADVFVSIHANSCQDYGELITGYIVHKSKARPDSGIDVFLRECIALNYGALVPLARSFAEPPDMLEYHAWQRIHPLTPGVILELGYMLADREILTGNYDLLAHAVTAGILCFIENAGLPPSQQALASSSTYLVPVLATAVPSFR